jgi:hypothetical protein
LIVVLTNILNTQEKKNPIRLLFFKIPSGLRDELKILAQLRYNRGWNRATVSIWWTMVNTWNKCYNHLKQKEQDFSQLQKQEE